MSTKVNVPAFSNRAQSWHTINWYQVTRQVKELQVRIAKATKEQRWHKVKTLQRMLIRSFAAKVLAVRRVTENRGKKTSAEWVMEGDIKGCFDNIDHDWLLANIPLDKQVLRKWLKSGFMESNRLFPTEAGTPQGGIISPVLANMVLDGLEKVLETHFGKKNTKASYKTRVNYVRYADDFIITGISKELLENEIKPLVEAFMAERGLQLSPEKTVITHIADGFDFLGQNLRKYHGKMLIKPSKKNLRNHLQKLRSIVRGNLMVRQDVLIRLLNPVLRG